MAVYILESRGLKVRVQGYGKVNTQLHSIRVTNHKRFHHINSFEAMKLEMLLQHIEPVQLHGSVEVEVLGLNTRFKTS